MRLLNEWRDGTFWFYFFFNELLLPLMLLDLDDFKVSFLYILKLCSLFIVLGDVTILVLMYLWSFRTNSIIWSESQRLTKIAYFSINSKSMVILPIY